MFRQSWEEFLSIFEWIGNRLLKLLVGWIKLLKDLGKIYEWSISVDFRRKCRQKLFSSSSWCPRLPLAAPLPPATTRLVDQSQIADNKTLTNWNWRIEHKRHWFFGVSLFFYRIFANGTSELVFNGVWRVWRLAWSLLSTPLHFTESVELFEVDHQDHQDY